MVVPNVGTKNGTTEDTEGTEKDKLKEEKTGEYLILRAGFRR